MHQNYAEQLSRYIRGFFSRLSGLLQSKELEANDKDTDEEDITDDDAVAIEAEVALDTLRQDVIADMSAAIHPVQVGRRNPCELSMAGKLNGLKLDELKLRSVRCYK